MWDYVDLELLKYNKEYDKENENVLDEFQNIFNNDVDLDEDASRSDLRKLQRTITNNYEYMSSYGQYEARKCLKRRRIKYRDWFWFYFFVIYSMQAYELALMENIIFKEVVDKTYNRELKDLSKVIKPKKGSINVDKLVKQPNSKGYVWSEYKDAMTLYNTNELHSMVIQNKRANKPLNVDNREFKKLFDKQKHRMISINEKKTSGALDNMLIYLANETKLQVYKDNDIKKCRFISVHDSKTTPMCRSLDKQIFNVSDWNEFYRYSEVNQAKVKYKIHGLLAGVNLPPINDYYHFCRSTITYILDKNVIKNTSNKLTRQAKKNTKRQEEIKNARV